MGGTTRAPAQGKFQGKFRDNFLESQNPSKYQQTLAHSKTLSKPPKMWHNGPLLS